MNKILLLLLSVVLFASSLNEEFVNFDKSFLLSSKTEQLAIHQRLKTIYIKSIISDDIDTKKEVLKRIILSSKTLKLDSSTYQKELQDLGINPNKISFNNINNTDAKKTKDIAKEQKSINTQNTKTQNTKTTTNTLNSKNINSQNKPETKQEEVKKTYITKINKANNTIEISLKGDFDNNIKSIIYNTKELKNKILEFNAALDIGKQNFIDKNYEVSLVQFNPEKVRFVLRSKSDLKLDYKIDNNVLLITIDGNLQEQNKQENTTQIKKSSVEDKKELDNNTKVNNNVKNATTNDKNKQESSINTKLDSNDNAANNIANDKNKKPITITKAVKKDNGVLLTLNNSLSNDDIKTFSYNNNQILEFDAVLNGGRKNYDFKTYSISVLQFNPKKARVVLYSKNTKKIFFNINNNSLEVSTDEISEKFEVGFKKSNLLITLDAGHGGKDVGATAFGRYEKNITLSIVLKLEKALKNKGYKVFLTRKKDVYINLRDRTKMANDKKSDLFISIHANSIGDKTKFDKIYGIETYFLSPARSERSKNAAAIENKSDIEEMNYFSKQTFLNFLNREKIISSNKLAIDIQGGILNNIPKGYLKRDGGVKEAPFWVLVGALMPAVLIEVGYISHPIEGKNIADSAYQDYLVNGIVNGIESYFVKNK
ncbi:N-acetylmuramoyl-L-alanine amidase [Campylobacter sp. RM12651]|uniref:N-acetylmuramoyl-L-alanine amidase family protein n=1 Tax=Campylobacter sp. RM12651 TaxID=1660079 RepID=UPI001EFAFF65|nr:N-acetylmuramoyl-L-alanine amidase [Campylobacter sp. RM12651]ULO03451.1 N-acetylmuramoyl-L-alanine amidase [Campylobacter sp. RM12651]